MALTPQIDGNIISLEQTEKVLPSKTYKINNDVVSTEIEIEEGKPTVVESDEMITIDDLSYEQISLNIKGNSWQETRSGKNILPNTNKTTTMNGVTFTINAGGSITVNGTNGGEKIAYQVRSNLPLKLNTKYTFSGCSNGSTSTYLMQIALNTNGTKQYHSVSVKPVTFEVTEETTAEVYIVIYANATVTNVTFYPQIEEGIVATDYEPYGAMPSPEFRSEIKNVTGSANITVCNENLFNSKLISNDSLMTINDDGSITIQNNSNAVGYYSVSKSLKELCPILKVGDKPYLYIETTHTNANIYLNQAQQSWTGGYPKVITQELLDSTVAIYGGNNGQTDTLKIMVTLNKLATEYIPHESQQFTFPLAEGQRMYKDSYLADDGVHHKRGQIILDGSEPYWSYESNLTRFVLTILNSKNDTSSRLEVISNNFKYQSNGNEDGICFLYGQKIYLYNYSITSLDDFKTWLSTHNTTIEYELAEEIIEPYTAEQQKVYNEINDILIESSVINIFSNDEIKPFVKVIYFSADNIIFNTGEKDRIIGYADGLEAIKQAIYHILNTERYAYLIYDDNYGVEFEQYIGKDFNFIQATIEDTLREALTHDLRITDVMVNSIDKIDSNVVAINFTATTVYGDLVLGVNINV